MLQVIENMVNSAVARYENDGTGSGDADAARARHEDKLIEYSEQKAKVEREAAQLDVEMAKTRMAINKLEDGDQKDIAIERYINRHKWNDIADILHISRAQMFRIHDKMLDQMAVILKNGRFD